MGLIAEVFHARVNGKEAEYKIMNIPYDRYCNVTTSLKNAITIEVDYKPGIELEIPVVVPQSKTIALIDELLYKANTSSS